MKAYNQISGKNIQRIETLNDWVLALNPKSRSGVVLKNS